MPSDFARGRNDLEEPACAVAPAVAEVIEVLAAAGGATLVRMSGSGATCFALYEDDAARDRASALLAARQPAWWRLESRFR
jgi:4-diphosphocytidyl-2-C-methyl-D-erythritol kinase